ncbi:MAG: hypothetical protein QM749_09165 [Aquabacterium sp.]
MLACSDFVSQSCTRHPALLEQLIASGDLLRPLGAAEFEARAPAFPPDSATLESAVMSELRQWRRREMVRIAWRDLAGWASLEEALRELSTFADAAIGAAYRHARQMLGSALGEPRSASGEIQPLLILGMGKLGGGELNFSSDVDLIFLVFPEHGETDGARSIANEEFFTRLGQAVIRLLDARNGMASSSAWTCGCAPSRRQPVRWSRALSFFEDYLLRHGRDWERYAYIKARPLTAPDAMQSSMRKRSGRSSMPLCGDYGMFESLREMKRSSSGKWSAASSPTT